MIGHFCKWFLAVVVIIYCQTASVRCRASDPGASAHYFAIEVVDDQTGRGVPLIELATVSHTSYWTDSAGMIALDDPALLDQKVFFYVRGPGYEYPIDGFGYRGVALEVKLGATAQVKVKRLNIAERLYRTTGEGIYRDSKLLGRKVPIEQPLFNSQVSGQDSVQSAVYRGKCYWFWGDTLRPSYPLGHFWTAGATSELPGKGGLDPAVGVNLNYFVDEQGFSRPMLERTDGMPCWLDGLMTLKDTDGTERLLARSSQMKGLTECIARQLVVFDDKNNRFEKSFPLPVDATLAHRIYPKAKTASTKVLGSGTGLVLITTQCNQPSPWKRLRASSTN